MAATLALGASLIVGGCGGSNTAERPKDEIVYVNFRDTRDLNPHLFAGEMYAQKLLYDTLITINPDGTYAPSLATSWEISPDGLTYTFKIREGVKFTDGEVCDAQAILANFNALNGFKERYKWTFLQVLDHFEVPDNNTFVIKLKEPRGAMMTELGVLRPFAMCSPKVMKNGLTKDGVTEYIGTGPYKLVEHVTDEYAVFERNEDHWGEKPAIRKITVKVIPDNQTRLLALEKGEIDLIFGKNMIDGDAVKKFSNMKGYKTALSSPASTRELVLNTTNPILNDLNVRRALNYATDRQSISDNIFYGFEPPAETLFAKNVPYANIDVMEYKYNADTAGQLLEQAGWTMGADGVREKNGQKLSLNLLYNVDSVMEKTISEYLQAEYAKFGVKLMLEPRLLIADEPTTALDALTQFEVLKAFRQVKESETAMVFITHDLGVANYISDRILVMNKGRIVDTGTFRQIVEGAKDSYTQLLIEKKTAVMRRYEAVMQGGEARA